MQVGKVKVSEGVYAYYKYIAEKTLPDATVEEIEAAAKSETLKYVATNSKFSDLSLSLATAQKSDVSKDVNSYWTLFGEFYSSLGITKQDLNKVELNKAYKKAIIRRTYDTKGTSPVPEEAVKAYFSENYIAFKPIIGLFQQTDDNGNITDLSDEKIALLTSQFNQMKQSIDKGTTFEQVNAAYQATSDEVEGTKVDTSVISKGSKSFPSGTFEKMLEIERGKTGVFTVGKYILLVQRENELADASFYTANRDDCLIALKTDEFEQTAAEWAKVLE